MKRYDLVEKIREVGVKNPDLQEILEEEVMNTVENFEIEDVKRAVRSFICKFDDSSDSEGKSLTRWRYVRSSRNCHKLYFLFWIWEARKKNWIEASRKFLL